MPKKSAVLAVHRRVDGESVGVWNGISYRSEGPAIRKSTLADETAFVRMVREGFGLSEALATAAVRVLEEKLGRPFPFRTAEFRKPG